MTAEPLVSCLMVTQPVAGRLAFMQRSVEAYCRQTHANRELVVVFAGDDAAAKTAIREHLASLARSDIRIVEAPTGATLGALRNISRDAGGGDVHCQWDDDDLHHPRRIEQQLDRLRETGGLSVCLQEVMQFFPATRTLFCTNWRGTEAKGLPGTLMCLADAPVRYPEGGAAAHLGEDTDVANQLQRLGGFQVLEGCPHLYVYISHGQNSWNDGHHQMLASLLSHSRGLLLRREAQLRQNLAVFDFGPGKLTVQGSNGAAFEMES